MAKLTTFSILLCIMFTFAVFASRLINAATAPAIFVFGDSTADVGTNTYINNCTIKATMQPYGIDFPNSTATGRWSDGFNTIDYLSQLMVDFADKSPEPYIVQNASNHPERFKTGANFASAGSGLLNETGFQAGVLPMFNQTEQFLEVQDYLNKTWGSYTSTVKISKSIFLISIGSNDILANYAVKENRLLIQKRNFVDMLITEYKKYIQKLYDAGARKFAIISVIAMGCCPEQRRLMPYGLCAEEQNHVSADFYVELETLLREFKYKYPETFHYAIGNTFELMVDVLEGKSLHDLKVKSTACCGIFRRELHAPCGSEGLHGRCCENRYDHAFWDGYHPTDAASKYAAHVFYHGNDTHLPRFVTPITFKELVKEF